MVTFLLFLWTLPNTLLGLILVLMGLVTGGRARFVGKTCEMAGGLPAWLLRHAVPLGGGASAITIGQVVLGKDAEVLSACRDHEAVHVRQYQLWGPLFIPAYFFASLVAWTRGGDAYRDNYFEREARLRSDER